MPDHQVVNSPTPPSYAAPLAGMALGQVIGDYPKDYFEGTQRARTLELQ
jgi:hypothetical protein